MQLIVPPEREGERLDAFLAEAVGSRAQAVKLIDAGAVLVDGKVVPKRHKVVARALVEVTFPVEAEAPADIGPAVAFAVPFEDEHLLVVDKPPGVVVHPARGHATGTLAQALAGTAVGGDEAWRAGIVHRLDRDTSGLLVVAKSDEAHRRLKTLLQAREITREYLALVDGRPPARSGTIDAPLGRDRRARTLVSTDTDVPKTAITHFTVEEGLPAATLLRVRLETGRTHQIRAHLKAIGFPVSGDPEYGVAGRYGLTRQFLHATRLAFAHPFGDGVVDVVSPLPPDLEAALQQARAA